MSQTSAIPIPSLTADRVDDVVDAVLARGPERSAARLARTGADAYALRALSARAATRTLDLMYYAWENDPVARGLAREALQAADRGVKVRVLVDDLACADGGAGLRGLAAHPNIVLRRHNPLRWRGRAGRVIELALRFAHLNHRMHNKAWIADGRLAIVGGRNIGERYFEAGEAARFRDLDILVIGAAAERARAIFESYWACEAVAPFTPVGGAPEAAGPPLAAVERLERGGLAACVDGAAMRRSDSIEVIADPPAKWKGRFRPGGRSRDRSAWVVTRLSRLLAGARREIRLVSPYFVPGARFSRVLTRKARAGTAVAVVTNSLAATDVVAVHGGYMRYRRRLLRGRVALFEMRAETADAHDRSVFGSSGASLHTKASLFDGTRGFVGSFNLDPRSARVNTEMGVLFDDAALAGDLAAEIDRLSTPGLSWSVALSGRRLHWRADGPAQHEEPGSTWRQRLLARVVGWLPIEQEL